MQAKWTAFLNNSALVWRQDLLSVFFFLSHFVSHSVLSYFDILHFPPRLLIFVLVLLVQGVANRDIKLENTLLDDSPWPLLKICDFGYSKVLCS